MTDTITNATAATYLLALAVSRQSQPQDVLRSDLYRAHDDALLPYLAGPSMEQVLRGGVRPDRHGYDRTTEVMSAFASTLTTVFSVGIERPYRWDLVAQVRAADRSDVERIIAAGTDLLGWDIDFFGAVVAASSVWPEIEKIDAALAEEFPSRDFDYRTDVRV